jgi:hypothetical protein
MDRLVGLSHWDEPLSILLPHLNPPQCWLLVLWPASWQASTYRSSPALPNSEVRERTYLRHVFH